MLGDLTAAGSPAGMRVIVRRERPHPGAQLSFTDVEGWRFGEFRHRHPGRAARAPRGPAPRSCPGRGSDPLRQEHRPESAAFAAVRDQRRPGRARPDRGGPDRLDPDHPARGRAGPRRARDVALPTAATSPPGSPAGNDASSSASTPPGPGANSSPKRCAGSTPCPSRSPDRRHPANHPQQTGPQTPATAPDAPARPRPGGRRANPTKIASAAIKALLKDRG